MVVQPKVAHVEQTDVLEHACNRHISARGARGARGACSLTPAPRCLLKWDRAEGSVRLFGYDNKRSASILPRLG